MRRLLVLLPVALDAADNGAKCDAIEDAANDDN